MIKLVVLSLCGLFLIQGCNYSHVKGTPDGGAGGQAKILSEVSFDYAGISQVILAPKCVSCHSAAGGNKGNLNLETYEQFRLNQNKIYFRTIEKRDMPPTPLTSAEFDLMKSWLEAGAPLKSTSVGGEIRGPINWITIKNRVLKSSCLDCHSGKNPDANLDLSSLEVVRKNIQAIFVSTMINVSMPLAPYPAMSISEKQALMKWISQGMPE